MIALPVCRWRQELTEGQFLCTSAKYCDPPNAVAAKFCAKCHCADHEPPPPLLRSLPCVHLGGLLRQNGKQRRAGADGEPQQFACALYGRCRMEPPEQHRLTDDRSCETCADYVARDPYGPDSSSMRVLAEKYLAAVPTYPKKRYHGRGVVIAGGGDRFFPSLYVTIRALRHVGCVLPIQVWYLGRNAEMPERRRALLAPFQVDCIDADKVRRRHAARRLDGWELKVFATLHSPFEELLYLDADSYPCRNPEFLFEQNDYKARGAIFWADGMAVDNRLKWPAFGIPDPRRLGSIESGQFVINKRLCWQPLNLAWFYNDHSDYYYRYCYGDKHTFEAAWARCARPFVMWQPQSPWIGPAFVHSGPDRAPLFVHRCRDKFRFKEHHYITPQYRALPSYYSSLPMEQECWQWLTELARLTRRQPPVRGAVEHFPPRRKRSGQARFAIATLYTPEIAELGTQTSKIMARYARRHGYEAVIAGETLDAARHPSWSKLLLIEDFLVNHPGCRWLMWIDADAVIANPARRLEDVVDESVDFLIARDLPPASVNAGVFLVRNCQAALDMLRLAYSKVKFLHHPNWEQPAVTEAIGECSATLRTRIVSRRRFNSYFDEYRKGDFVLHFAGCAHEVKLAGVKSVFDSMGRQFRRPAAEARSRGRRKS
jgi:hypothetical protein